MQHLTHTLGDKLNSSLKWALAIAVLTVALNSVIIAQVNTGGASPLAVTGGAPTGSYALSDFDTVNLFNGNLNFNLPLLTVGGRGSAQHTISLPVERKWIAQSYWDPGMQMNVWYFTDYQPAVLVPDYGPGVVHGFHGLFYPQTCAASTEESYLYTLSKLVFTAPDGTEYELLDTNNSGNVATVPSCSPTRYNRGRIFKSVDGSGVTFISDSDILDYYFGVDPSYPFGVNGYLLLPDGTRMRVDNSVVTWKLDRNGNKISFAYDYYGRLSTITDSLGRQVTINHAVNDVAPYGTSDQIIYSGFGGTQRTIRVSYTDLNSALRTTQPGDSSSVQNCLTLNAGAYNPTVVSSVWLPDGRRYRLFYNCFGELARVVLPTGGAIEYDHGAGLEGGSPYGDFSKPSAQGGEYPQVYRRVRERRIYPDGQTLAGKMTYGRQETYNPSTLAITNTGYVDVDQRDANGTLLTRDRHYFLGSASPSLNESPFYQPTDLGAPKEWKTESFDSNGSTILRRMTHTWAWSTVFGQGPHISQTEATLVDTNQVAKQTFLYDQYNNLTDAYEYDYGAGAAGPLVRRTHTDYLVTNPVNGANYSSNAIHIRNLPTQQQTFDAAGVERARTTFEYDNYAADANHAGLASCPGITQLDAAFNTAYQTRGNMTRVSRWLLSAGTSINTYAQYDVAGNTINALDGRGQITQAVYSGDYQYAFQTSTASPIPDPAGTFGTNTALTSVTAYDFWTGLATSSTDANGKTVTVQYNDLLDRPTYISRPSGGGWTSFEYGDTVGNLYVRKQTALDASRATDNYQFFDGLGRGVRSFQYVNSNPSNPWLTSDTVYDSIGRASKVSNPYWSAGSTSAVNPSGNWTVTLYDALSRVRTVTKPDGAAVTSVYNGNQTTVTDPAGKSRRSVKDGLGRLTSVIEAPSGLAYQTIYSYDALGNLHTVAQDTQHRYFMYDSLSRLIRAKAPEQNDNPNLALSDPLSGNSQWSVAYSYDANDNLLTKTDARNVTATFTYDNINRNTNVNYSDGTPAVVRYYDNAVNGRGKLWLSYAGPSHTANDNYDAMGRLTTQRQQFYANGGWGAPYVTQRAFDLAGNVTSQTYPSGRIVNYAYDPAGRTTSFAGNLGDGVNRNYAAAISYDEWNGISREQFGTDTPLYHKEHRNIRGQMYDVRLSTVNDDLNWNRGAVVNYYSFQVYGFGTSGPDNNGNLLAQQYWIPNDDAINSYSFMQQNYDYDALNRLKWVGEYPNGNGAGSTGSQDFSYDRYGNRSNSAWGTGINNQQFAVNVNNTNRLGVPAGVSGVMQYDANGNLINDTYSGAGARAYDSENRMVSATNNLGQQSVYTYDADGKRVRRSSYGQETWQVYGMDGELLAEYAANAAPAQPQKEFGYRNGQLLVSAEPAQGQTTTESVVWQSAAGVSVNGNSLTKTAVEGWGNSGAVSIQQLISGNGYVEFMTNETNTYKMCGLSNGDSSLNYNDIDFALYLVSGGNIQVYEGGAYRGQFVTYAPGDHFRVAVESNVVKYSKNGVVFYTSTIAPTYPLLADTALYSSGATITNVTVSGNIQSAVQNVSWTNVAGVTASGNSLTRQTADAWDGGAVSTQTLASGNGYVEFMTGEPNTYKMCGLSNGDSNQSYTDIDFALYLTAGGSVQVYESGVYKGTFGGYTASDHFRVAVEGGAVKYSQNGAVFYTSAVAPAYPLLVDTSLYSNGTHLNDVMVGGNFAGGGGGSLKLQWLVMDQLGTPRMIADKTGSLAGISRHDYLPFGEELFAGSGARTQPQGYQSNDKVRQQFAQYERDTETGLDFAQARYYSSQQGRFTGVDPVMIEKGRLDDPQALNLYAYTRNNPLKYVDPDGEKYKGTDGKEVIIEREKVNGKKVWVIKSNNATNDLKKLVDLINKSGSSTASAQFDRLNKHATMINIVIDTTTARSQQETDTGIITRARHQPHDQNGPLTFNDATENFDGKADSAVDAKGNEIAGAYREATITIYEKKLRDSGQSGNDLDDSMVSEFGHEAQHDLDPAQVRAGKTGAGSNAIWHPMTAKKEFAKGSPNWYGNKIMQEITKARGGKP